MKAVGGTFLILRQTPHLRITLYTLTALKTALLCISFLRKGELLAYVGRIHNLKDLKGRRAFLRVPSTVGRNVCLCWEHSKPQGPKGPWDKSRSFEDYPLAGSAVILCVSLYRGASCDPKGSMAFLQKKTPVSVYVGNSKNLEDLKEKD